MRKTVSDTFKMRAQNRKWFNNYIEICIEFQDALFDENDQRSYKTIFIQFLKKVQYQQNKNPFKNKYIQDFLDSYAPKVEVSSHV